VDKRREARQNPPVTAKFGPRSSAAHPRAPNMRADAFGLNRERSRGLAPDLRLSLQL